MRRPVTVLLALVLLLAACSKPERPTLERVTGTIGPSAPGEVGGGTDGVQPDGTDAASPDPQSSGSSDTSATNSDPAASAAAAESALTAYFDALQARDFARAQQVSTGAAEFMARIRNSVDRYNTERDGTTSLRYPERSFRVDSSDAQRITYVGRARLESTVSGPAGDPHTESALFENPSVTLVGGAWRVGSYSYDGLPVDHFPATASKRVGGVDFRLQGALNLGSVTGLLIDLVTDADHSIKVDNVRLARADGAEITPKLAALVTQQPAGLYYLFDRSSSRPTVWAARVIIDEGTPAEVTSEVVLRF